MLKHVVASSAESETTAVFHNTQITLLIYYMLTCRGHKQLLMPTIKPQRISSKITLQKNARNIGICVFAGCEIRPSINIFIFIGRNLNIIWLISLQNHILSNIISLTVLNMFLKCYVYLSWRGVLGYDNYLKTNLKWRQSKNP